MVAAKRVKVGVGIVAVARHGFGGFAQLVLVGVVHDQAKFLLRGVRLGPDLALLGQEQAANQRRQLFVARRHLLQRRVVVRKPEGLGAVVLRAVRIDLGMDAAVDLVVEDLLHEVG